jgi:uncharacterized membrane protein YqiK
MRPVKDKAVQSLHSIGGQPDVFNIQNIADNNGYLDAPGQRRIAEVKREVPDRPVVVPTATLPGDGHGQVQRTCQSREAVG